MGVSWRGSCDFSVIGLAMVAVSGIGVWAFNRIVATGFLPEDDQGALFVVVQLPGGASVVRTADVIKRAETILREEEAVEDITSVIGLNFIDNYSQSNAAFMVVTLKSFHDREDRALHAPQVIARLNEKFRQIQGGTVVPMAPPPILGLGTGGGFAFVLQDVSGGDPKALAQVLQGLVVAANADPKLSRVFSTYSATNPSIYLNIDRDKAQILGVPLNDLFQVLQASLGGFYVNDVNLFGRRWQVQVQAEADDRSSIDDVYRINVRSTDGKMIPLRSLVEVKVVVRSPSLVRYNNLRAVTAQGTPAPGISSGQALKAMEEVAANTLPKGYAGEWTDTAFQEKRAEGKTAIILGFAVLFAYLFLVGLYESWTIPVPVLLSVTVGILGSYGAIALAGLTLDLYAQIGMGRLDRPRRQERHSDLGICQGAERARRTVARGRDGGSTAALPSGHDDVARLHTGASALGDSDRCLRAGAARRRDAGIRRDDSGVCRRDFCNTAAVCLVPGRAGEIERSRTAVAIGGGRRIYPA